MEVSDDAKLFKLHSHEHKIFPAHELYNGSYVGILKVMTTKNDTLRRPVQCKKIVSFVRLGRYEYYKCHTKVSLA